MSTIEKIRNAAQKTFKDHLELLSAGQIEKWVDLFTENGILEFPYGPADFPKMIEGKTALFEYMQNFPKHLKWCLKTSISMLPRIRIWLSPNFRATVKQYIRENLTISGISQW